MAIGAANGAVRDLRGALASNRATRPAVVVGAVIATVSVLAGGWVASRLLARWLRAARNTARFAYSFATLRAFSRCADCKRLIRADAKVCSHCGYRKPVKRGRRERKREPQPATVA
jgi:ABC-type transport system involved in cytochrome c biogenesis permease subunit